jgi:hypothetical protein
MTAITLSISVILATVRVAVTSYAIKHSIISGIGMAVSTGIPLSFMPACIYREQGIMLCVCCRFPAWDSCVTLGTGCGKIQGLWFGFVELL